MVSHGIVAVAAKASATCHHTPTESGQPTRFSPMPSVSTLVRSDICQKNTLH
jgi:hypothetical protein